MIQIINFSLWVEKSTWPSPESQFHILWESVILSPPPDTKIGDQLEFFRLWVTETSLYLQM